MRSKNLPGARRTGRTSGTCPVSGCKHPVLLHDVDEIPGVRVERCTVQDCPCSGLVAVDQ